MRSRVAAVAISQDNHSVLSADLYDGTVWLWDIAYCSWIFLMTSGTSRLPRTGSSPVASWKFRPPNGIRFLREQRTLLHTGKNEIKQLTSAVWWEQPGPHSEANPKNTVWPFRAAWASSARANGSITVAPLRNGFFSRRRSHYSVSVIRQRLQFCRLYQDGIHWLTEGSVRPAGPKNDS